MAIGIVKCPGCGQTFDRRINKFEFVKNRYWHKECYDAHINKIKNDEQNVESLNNYICLLFSVDYVPPMIQKQIKEYIENYGYTHSGILGTLKYWYDIKKNPIEKAFSRIGIVPYVYEDAKKYYQTLYNSKESNKDVKKEDFTLKEIKIKIKPPSGKVNSKNIINLDQIEREINERKPIF